jgi:hypothetical protein
MIPSLCQVQFHFRGTWPQSVILCWMESACPQLEHMCVWQSVECLPSDHWCGQSHLSRRTMLTVTSLKDHESEDLSIYVSSRGQDTSWLSAGRTVCLYSLSTGTGYHRCAVWRASMFRWVILRSRRPSRLRTAGGDIMGLGDCVIVEDCLECPWWPRCGIAPPAPNLTLFLRSVNGCTKEFWILSQCEGGPSCLCFRALKSGYWHFENCTVPEEPRPCYREQLCFHSR